MPGLTQWEPDLCASFGNELSPGLDLFLKFRGKEKKMGPGPIVLAWSKRQLLFLLQEKEASSNNLMLRQTMEAHCKNCQKLN